MNNSSFAIPAALRELIGAHMADHEYTILAIEGGSASGKTTLARLLSEAYGAGVIHMDDFFLRPEQRTQERRLEPGGNLDRERFAAEVLPSLMKHETVLYSPFRCATGTPGAPRRVAPTSLIVVEGAYAAHPAFGRYYDILAFADVDPLVQKERILHRNTPQSAACFFDTWIPLEETYFKHFSIKEKSDIVISL